MFYDNHLKANYSVESTVQSIINCSINYCLCYHYPGAYYIAGISCQQLGMHRYGIAT